MRVEAAALVFVCGWVAVEPITNVGTGRVADCFRDCPQGFPWKDGIRLYSLRSWGGCRALDLRLNASSVCWFNQSSEDGRCHGQRNFTCQRSCRFVDAS